MTYGIAKLRNDRLPENRRSEYRYREQADVRLWPKADAQVTEASRFEIHFSGEVIFC